MNQENLQILKRVLADYDRAEIAYWDKISEEFSTPAAEFYARLWEIPYQKKKNYVPVVSFRPKKAIAIFVALIALLLALTMSVSAIRTSVFDFFESIYDSYVCLFVNNKDYRGF